MPAFYIIVILAAFALWISLASEFKPLGKWAYRLLSGVKDAMHEDEDDKIEKETKS